MIETNDYKGTICPLFTAAFAEQEECINKCAIVLYIDGKRKCSIRIIAEALSKTKDIAEALSKIKENYKND